LAPKLFGLTGPAKAICCSFPATQGTPNALTDTVLQATQPLPPFLPQTPLPGPRHHAQPCEAARRRRRRHGPARWPAARLTRIRPLLYHGAPTIIPRPRPA
jgi:hypothetical protein